MVLGDLMGFIKMRAWFWGSCATLSALLIGNIMGVFDLNIMGSLISLVNSMFGGH